MTSTPSLLDEAPSLHEWVELNFSSGEVTRSCNTPIPVSFSAGVEKLLLEAQREGSISSSQVSSRIPSRGGSPHSPKSPASEGEMTLPDLSLYAPKELSITKEEFIAARQRAFGPALAAAVDSAAGNGDWIWDWSSRPDQQPPKEWKFVHPQKSRLSFRCSKIAKRGFFSTEVLSFVVLTNIISLLLGAGIGLYIGKRFTSAISTFGKSLD